MTIDNQVLLVINLNSTIVASVDGIVGQEVLLQSRKRDKHKPVSTKLPFPLSPSTGKSNLQREGLYNILKT